MRLELESCVVRDWQAEDKASLVRVANNRNVWRNLNDIFPHPYTLADADRWLALQAATAKRTAWAIEVEGQAAGGVGLTPLQGIERCMADFGYWLAEPYWGRGIMTEVVQAVAPHAMQAFGLARLESWVFEWNPASMRVLDKCGFVREGVMRASAIKDGQLIDRVLYALVRRA